MNEQELRDLFKITRITQRDYFSGNKSVLNKSKRLERLCDIELGIIPRPESDQLTMF